MISDFLRLLLLLLFYFRIDQAHSDGKVKCRGIPIDQMKPFKYQSDQWKKPMEIKISYSEPYSTYIGYIDEGMGKQCVLIRFYGHEYKLYDEKYRRNYENSIKISKILTEIDTANEHFVKLIDYGTIDKSNPMIKGEKWVTISELGHRDLKEELKKAREIPKDLEEVSEAKEEIKTMLKDLMKPLVEFHKVGIHLDFKLKNLIVFEKTEEEDEEEVEEELPKMEEKKAKKEKSKLMKMFHRKNKAEHKAKEEKEREEKEREEKEREEKKRVEKEREEKERTKTIKWEEKVIKLIGSDAPVFYLDEQKKVTPKMDIWSAGLIILQLTLTKTFGYKETDKEIGELFRSAKLKFVRGIDGKGGEFKPDPTKLELPIYIYECPAHYKYDEYWPSKNWWDNYLTVIHDILTVWDKMSEIVFLSVNMLNIDAEKRMSAKGIIDYLEGKCKPKEYEKNTEKIALFGDVSGEKLKKFMGENHKGFDMFEKYLNDEFEHAMDDKREKKAKEDLNKVENIKKTLIKNAVKSTETFLKELDKRAEICDH